MMRYESWKWLLRLTIACHFAAMGMCFRCLVDHVIAGDVLWSIFFTWLGAFNHVGIIRMNRLRKMFP